MNRFVILICVLVLGFGTYALCETVEETATDYGKATHQQDGFITGNSLIETITWTTKAPLPDGRSRLCAAAVDSLVYYIGGEGTGGSRLGWVNIFNPRTNTFTAGANMPTGVSNICCDAIGENIYVPGGYTGTGSNLLQIYNTRTNTWSTGTNVPQAIFGVATAVWGGKLYVIGGVVGTTYQTTCYEYDPVAQTWATKAPMTVARAYFDAAAVNGVVYAIGGRDGSTADFNTNEAYTIATNTWATRTPMSVGRGGVGAGALDGRVYAIGGGWSSYLTSVEWYNPTSNTWTTDTPMSVGRRTIGVAVIDNVVSRRLFVGGGWAGAYQTANEEGLTDAPFGIEIGNPIKRETGFSLITRPNPTRGLANVEFSLPKSGTVSLKVYDISGKLISTLVDGRLEAGSYISKFETKTSGVYLARLETKETSLVRRIVVAR